MARYFVKAGADDGRRTRRDVPPPAPHARRRSARPVRAGLRRTEPLDSRPGRGAGARRPGPGPGDDREPGLRRPEVHPERCCRRSPAAAELDRRARACRWPSRSMGASAPRTIAPAVEGRSRRASWPAPPSSAPPDRGDRDRRAAPNGRGSDRLAANDPGARRRRPGAGRGTALEGRPGKPYTPLPFGSCAGRGAVW